MFGQAALGHIACVRMLKRSPRIAVGCTNHKGENALHLAARFGNMEMLRELIERRSPKRLQELLTARTVEHRLTAVQVARVYNHHDFADALESQLRQLNIPENRC